MKQFIFSTLAIVGLLAFISCERHEWENSAEGKKDGAKNLYPKKVKEDNHSGHGDHGKAAADHAGQDH